MSADFSYLEDPCAALEAGTHDVVLLFDYDRAYEQYDENSRFKFVLLGEAPFSVIMAQTSPLAVLESITLDDLAGQTVVSPKQFAYTKFQVPYPRSCADAASALTQATPTTNRSCLPSNWGEGSASLRHRA